ncbi:nucleoside/nucleotide kinase family protein [Gordonia polyisoprenivorans]|uniref:nucleoside/nucleotide kinase family protein n=1 Tax=Gordonia polyisoprenivorans TaxID=84595 RepID=UPI001FCA643F|nr:nucleoside/nucleotide kinase family protein [Gordonia polyisoprenivorans]
MSNPTTEIIEAAADTPRFVAGFTGPPGAGKTTIARRVVAELTERFGDDAVGYLPMDGFHLATTVLRRLGRTDRRGAPDTFDVDGFVSLLRRAAAPGKEVYAPDFDHRGVGGGVAEPIAAALIIPATAKVLVVEGNYLALDGEWSPVRDLIDRLWFVDVPDDVRRERLSVRHVGAGRSAENARRWIESVDDPNAALIRSCRHRCDVLLDGTS